MGVLDNHEVLVQFRQAWEDSRPGASDAHEEGGFVLRNADGSVKVERWPRGSQDQIIVPPHPDGLCGDGLVIATFHTHPNVGADYQQEPSLTDIRAVGDDPDLEHPEYEGELVISELVVYLIRKDGSVEEMGETSTLLSKPS